MAVDDQDRLLAEQVAYYGARAGEYFDGIVSDVADDNDRTPEELIEGESSSTIQRRLARLTRYATSEGDTRSITRASPSMIT